MKIGIDIWKGEKFSHEPVVLFGLDSIQPEETLRKIIQNILPALPPLHPEDEDQEDREDQEIGDQITVEIVGQSVPCTIINTELLGVDNRLICVVSGWIDHSDGRHPFVVFS